MDPQLVIRAQGGDEVAFALITRAVNARFKQVAYRILRDRHLAEDAMQQALVEIWRKLPTLRDPERFDGWSYRFLVHACYREGKRYRDSYRDLPGERELVHSDGTAAVNDRDQLERGFRRLSLDQWVMVPDGTETPIYVSRDGLAWQAVPRPDRMLGGFVAWMEVVGDELQAFGIQDRRNGSPSGFWTIDLASEEPAPFAVLDADANQHLAAPVAFAGGYLATGNDSGEGNTLTIWQHAAE